MGFLVWVNAELRCINWGGASQTLDSDTSPSSSKYNGHQHQQSWHQGNTAQERVTTGSDSF